MTIQMTIRRNTPMSTFSVAEAKANLSKLLERAEKGEKVVITSARLRALRAAMPKAKTPADKLVRRMRDEKY